MVEGLSEMGVRGSKRLDIIQLVVCITNYTGYTDYTELP